MESLAAGMMGRSEGSKAVVEGEGKLDDARTAPAATHLESSFLLRSSRAREMAYAGSREEKIPLVKSGNAMNE